MNNEEFTNRTNALISSKQLQTVNSVQELRVSLTLYNHLPDVVTLYKQGGIELIENIEQELLLLQKHCTAISEASHNSHIVQRRLKALLKKEKL